jgi:hypothetical protein
MNKYYLDNYVTKIVELIYPSKKRKIKDRWINYPRHDTNIDDCNRVIDEIANTMKELCVNMKTDACMKYINNMSQWLENNKATLSETVIERYRKQIDDANKWLEEHPQDVVEPNGDIYYDF